MVVFATQAAMQSSAAPAQEQSRRGAMFDVSRSRLTSNMRRWFVAHVCRGAALVVDTNTSRM